VSPLSFNDLVVERAERVFMADIPGERTVALVLCTSGGTAKMAKLEHSRARRLGRCLLDATARGDVD
jgi:hypothetical protein